MYTENALKLGSPTLDMVYKWFISPKVIHGSSLPELCKEQSIENINIIITMDMICGDPM